MELVQLCCRKWLAFPAYVLCSNPVSVTQKLQGPSWVPDTHVVAFMITIAEHSVSRCAFRITRVQTLTLSRAGFPKQAIEQQLSSWAALVTLLQDQHPPFLRGPCSDIGKQCIGGQRARQHSMMHAFNLPRIAGRCLRLKPAWHKGEQRAGTLRHKRQSRAAGACSGSPGHCAAACSIT